jgi:selenide,water dikinase
MPRPPALLVGTETRDDASVWRLDARTALVSTVDFFAPVVDDPRAYGAIAAANALSDVWAMGGRPIYALSIVGFPRDLGGHGPRWDVLGEILAGAADTCHSAGCAIVGGHSVDDVEPKFGLAVTGLVHPDRVLTNHGARAGDALLLTKALGTGVAVSAIKKGSAPPLLVQAATAQMLTLNRTAGELLARSHRRVHALTDVTGFGLLGHLDSMLRASGARARIDAGQIPLLPEVRRLAATGVMPGGSKANLAFVSERCSFSAALSESDRQLLADAQTNGGLLAAVDRKAAPRLLRRLADAGAPAVLLGEVTPAGARGPGVDVEGALRGS